MDPYDLGPGQLPPSKVFHGARLDRWWGRRRIAETGEAAHGHRVEVSSAASIVAWTVLGLGLIGLAVWLWHVFALFTLLVGLVGSVALWTGIGKWRENRWLKPRGARRGT
jgi:DNA-binding transcriptional LysR family regulator